MIVVMVMILIKYSLLNKNGLEIRFESLGA